VTTLAPPPGATSQMRPHHIGFAVADLDASMATVGAALGLHWHEPLEIDQEFRVGDRAVRWQLRVVKSTGADGITVELLQGSPGTIWHLPDGIAFHHYAHAPADRAAAHVELRADGWSIEISRNVPDVPATSFAYFVRPGSSRVEICLP
jgi:catechol 2,3-dioxygenase-like lactoylglutathione lyase family enzyme